MKVIETKVNANLPDTILNFAYTIRKDVDLFHRIIKQGEMSRLGQQYNELNGMFTKLEKRILLRFLFVSEFCKIQSLDRGHFCGNVNRKLSRAAGSYLYVTDNLPIESNGKVLLLLSSVSPARTTMLLIDDKLSSSVIYDSYTQKNNCIMEKGIFPIRVVYSIQVNKANEYILRESGNNLETDFERKLVLKLKGNMCQISRMLN